MTISSPSRHALARHDKAGNQPTKYKDLSDILLQETRTAQGCDFDDFLRAFIFRCLRDDLSLESLQDKIEKLERAIDLNADEKSELGLLQKERDDSLQKHLEQCLHAVLPVANDKSIKPLLSAYLKSLSRLETKRYAPYVKLCNYALSLLKERNDLPLRLPTSPELQYRRLDAAVFKTHAGTDHVHRKPDVGKAGHDAVKSLGSQLEEPPEKGVEPEFDSFFGFEEFKGIGIPSKQARTAVKGVFTIARCVHVRQQDNEIDEIAQIIDDAADTQSSTQTPPTEGLAPNANATMSSSTSSSKRKLEVANNLPSTKKLCLGIEDGVEQRKESSDRKNFDGRVQCAAYALEMLSQNPGMQHTINLLHIDDCLFISYYDREGIVRSNGISFIADFPRALVLLALFQRFRCEDWGRNATFGRPPNVTSFTISLNDPLLENKYNPKDFTKLKISCSAEDYLSPRPRCLGGRATRVVACEAKLKNGYCSDEPAVVKISHPEARRTHEGQTMKGIRNIATNFDASMTDHLPELLCYADVRGTDTGRIRSLVGQPGNGYRIMRMVVMKKLEKITTLDAASFIRAWFDVLTCHAFLWKHGIEHGDPSLYNIMCHPVTHRGVLTDFDLSILHWEEGVPGCDRTGTIPFMALELLKEGYWTGDIKRYYHHEMEAFTWCLPFMCLGGFVAGSKRHKVITEWVMASPADCQGKKFSFISNALEYSVDVHPSFAARYQLATELCWAVSNTHTKFSRQRLPNPAAQSLDLWMECLAALRSTSWRKTESPSMLEVEDSFIAPLIERLEKHRPCFATLDDIRKSELKDLFLADTEPSALKFRGPRAKESMKDRQGKVP